MIPDKSHPEWQALVKGEKHYTFQSLGVKIMMKRILMSVEKDPSSDNITHCVEEVHRFFDKNELSNKSDIKQIFGEW